MQTLHIILFYSTILLSINRKSAWLKWNKKQTNTSCMMQYELCDEANIEVTITVATYKETIKTGD